MQRIMLSAVAVFALVSCAFAQPQTPDERVRTSGVAPDLHNVAGGWQAADKTQLVYHNPTFTVRVVTEYYVNEKEHMTAFLQVLETNGKREEVAMLYGSDNVARGAIKSGGAWHVSKVVYFDNGQQNPKGDVIWTMIPDKNDPKKPTGARLFLDTVDGPKELIVDLQ